MKFAEFEDLLQLNIWESYNFIDFISKFSTSVYKIIISHQLLKADKGLIGQSATNVKVTRVSNVNCFAPGCASLYIAVLIKYFPSGITLLMKLFDPGEFSCDMIPMKGHFFNEFAFPSRCPWNMFLTKGFFIEFRFSTLEQ